VDQVVDDLALLRRFSLTRDAEAFATLSRRHAGLVYGVCLRIVQDPHEAEDVAQDCFFELARKSGQITSSLAGWLHSQATHRAIDAVRDKNIRRRSERAAQVVGDARPAADPLWAEIAPAVDRALEELPDDLRQVLILHYLEGRTQAELAVVLHTTQPTISRRLENGVEQLRAQLRKAEIMLPAALSFSFLSQAACVSAPKTLLASLGKMALAGVGSVGAPGPIAVVSTMSLATKALLWAICVAVVVAAGLSYRGFSRPFAEVPKTATSPPNDPPSSAGPSAPAQAINWQVVDAKVDNNLCGACFITADEGWVAGSAGLILHTPDGGRSWTRQLEGLPNVDFLAIRFFDSRTGWACGRACNGDRFSPLFKTSDGGRNWVRIDTGTNTPLSDLWPLTRDCILVTSGVETRQHRDGNVYVFVADQRQDVRRASRALRSINFPSLELGFAAGSDARRCFNLPEDPLREDLDSRLIRTRDGGRSWTECHHPALPEGVALCGLSFSDAKNGWVCGGRGALFSTHDGGDTWQKQNAGTGEEWVDVCALASQRVWLLGLSGAVYHSKDDGQTWACTVVRSGLQRLCARSPQQVVAVGKSGTIVLLEAAQDDGVFKGAHP
jgi:RNA polymerase sigma factor (sigma-70 family)